MSGLGFGQFAEFARSGRRLEIFIAGMDLGGEALRGGNLPEECCKLFCFGALEAGGHELVVGACEVADLCEGIGAAWGEAEGVETAILGVGSAGEEFGGF